MPAVFFLHLQKTGGTSINRSAVEQFSRDRVLMLYGPESQWTSPAARQIMHQQTMPARDRLLALSNYIERNDIAFFSSHLSASRLHCFDPSRAFTILREPVERVISQYFFFRSRNYTDETLESFIERPEYRNHQARALKGVALEGLAAVGVMERYEPFLACLNRRLGLRFEPVHEKRAGFLKDLRARMVTRSVRSRIAKLNEDDAVLYERALGIARQQQG